MEGIKVSMAQSSRHSAQPSNQLEYMTNSLEQASGSRNAFMQRHSPEDGAHEVGKVVSCSKRNFI